jgi:pyruvate dehydrogenase E1 component alpha subunit/2-oxoisovalerate dehydrogenase E1 component alpha subunit
MAAPPGIPAGLTRDNLLELYYFMRLTRSLEERLVNLYRQTKVIGGLYRSLGQEADSVGSAYALDRERGDFLSPLTRNLGSMLVQGATSVEILRQYMAKGTSPTQGRELNIHYGDLKRGFIGQISPLGDMVPVMAGVALSFKMRREPRVALVYVGEGAMSTGAFHEGVNLAAVLRLPMVVIAENNGYSYTTPTEKQSTVKHLKEKAKAYGIPGVQADGNDVLTVYRTTKAAVERAREGHGVTLIELVTFRRKGHAEHDSQAYVPKEQLEYWEKKDPIDRYIRQLTENSWASQGELDATDIRIADELDQAIALVEPEPVPDVMTVLDGVTVNPPGAEHQWFDVV